MAKATFFCKINICQVFLKKTSTRTPLTMSTFRISIPYDTMVEILGPPHHIEEHEILKYDVFAKWNFSVLDKKIEIEYDSSEWILDYMRNKNLTSGRIPPLKDNTFGKIHGDREIVQNIVFPVLKIESGDYNWGYKVIEYIFNY